MWQSLHRRDLKTYERQDKGAWPRHPTCPYPDLRRFRARPQHRTLSALGWGKVYWSWSLRLYVFKITRFLGLSNNQRLELFTSGIAYKHNGNSLFGCLTSLSVVAFHGQMPLHRHTAPQWGKRVDGDRLVFMKSLKYAIVPIKWATKLSCSNIPEKSQCYRSWKRKHETQLIGMLERDHAALWHRVAVYRCSYRRCCRSCATETREWPQPYRALNANTCSDRRPSELRNEIQILSV